MIAALSGRVSQSEIARQLGVSQSLVSQVASGRKSGGYAANRRVLPSSGIKGVSQTRSGKWQARITRNKTSHHLGTFVTKDAAAQAIMDWIADKIGVTSEDLKNGRAA